MPKLLIVRNFIFLLFSVDVNEKRKHIHVEMRKGHKRKLAKFWLEPKIELFDKGNLKDKELKEAEKIIQENYEILISQINKFFSGKKLTIIKK